MVKKNARWDTSRITDFAEILGFYGLTYWYCFQVSALGVGPIFLGSNEALKKKPEVSYKRVSFTGALYQIRQWLSRFQVEHSVNELHRLLRARL